MDVRKLDDLLAQGRSIFDMKLAVAYYARGVDRKRRTAQQPG